MIDRFLKAKHWQIFMLISGLPIILQIITTTMMFTNEAPPLARVCYACRYKLHGHASGDPHQLRRAHW